MAQAVLIQVADAVKADLEAGTFSQQFTVRRAYRPTFDLAELDALRVTVVPKSVDVINASRRADYFDCVVDVGIQKRVTPDDTQSVDVMADFVAEIVNFLRHRTLAQMPDAMWLRIRNEPAWVPEHLDEHRTFTSVVEVTYRVARTSGS